MSKLEHLLKLKTQLAEKYAHLATLTSSKPRRAKLSHEALKYRRQAKNLENQIRSANS